MGVCAFSSWRSCMQLEIWRGGGEKEEEVEIQNRERCTPEETCPTRPPHIPIHTHSHPLHLPHLHLHTTLTPSPHPQALPTLLSGVTSSSSRNMPWLDGRACRWSRNDLKEGSDCRLNISWSEKVRDEGVRRWRGEGMKKWWEGKSKKEVWGEQRVN